MANASRRAGSRARFSMGVSLATLCIAGQAGAQSLCPNGSAGPVCTITNTGSTGPITGTTGTALLVTNSGTITGNAAIAKANSVVLVVNNQASGTIDGSAGTAIHSNGAPLLSFAVANAGTINGNVILDDAPGTPNAFTASSISYMSGGGTLNGDLQLGTTGFSSGYFLQRGATSGVTGTISAGGGLDIYAKSYGTTQAIQLGQYALPATFEIEGYEVLGTGTTLTLVGAPDTEYQSTILGGDGNVVNTAEIGLVDVTGLFPLGVEVIPAAVSYRYPSMASFLRPGFTPGQAQAFYATGFGSALQSFTNDGIVNGDIRLATRSFVNAGEINLLTHASGTVIHTAANADFSFVNSGDIVMAFNGLRTGGAVIEAPFDGYVQSAIRIRSALDTTEATNAVSIENSGTISGGLDAFLAAETLTFENSGTMTGINTNGYFAPALTINMGELNLVAGPDPRDEYNGQSASFLNTVDGEIVGGVELELAANNVTIENRGRLIAGNPNMSAFSVDQELLSDDDDEVPGVPDAVAASLSFVNSGTIEGDLDVSGQTANMSITNSGAISRAAAPFVVGQAPLFGGGTGVEIENFTEVDQQLVIVNTGTIIENEKGGTAVAIEVEAGDSDPGVDLPPIVASASVTVTNSGTIAARGGATVTPGQFLPQIADDQFLVNPFAALVIDATDVTGTSIITVNNLQGGTIAASGNPNVVTPGGYSPVQNPVNGGSGGALLAAAKVVNITNSGRIEGGPGVAYAPAANFDDMSLPDRYLAGAIQTAGDDLEGSVDTLLNTATGVIIGSIDLGAADDTITNLGSINGAVFLRGGNDEFVNSGALTGAVTMGAGDDLFIQLLAAAAQFNGTVDGGEGNDTLHFDITGSDGLYTQTFRNLFTGFEVFSVVGTGTVVVAEEVVITDGGTLVLDEDSAITVAPGETAVSGSAEGETVANGGTITGNIDLGEGDNAFANEGTVTGDVVVGGGSDEIANNGTVTGNVGLGEGDNSFANQGTVTGNVTAGAGSDAIANGGTVVGDVGLGDGDNSFANEGNVTGDVTAGAGSDQIVNAGTIAGNVDLGEGEDEFVNDGTIEGNVDLGGGSDTYVLGAGNVTGTVSGGDGDEVDNVQVGETPESEPEAATLQMAEPSEGLRTMALTTADVDGALAPVDLSTALSNVLGFEQVTVAGDVHATVSADLPVAAVILEGSTLEVQSGASLGATITGSDADETLITQGSIGGNVDLGAGDDAVVVGTGASFGGTLDGGDGDDSLGFANSATYAAPSEIDGSAISGFETLSNDSGTTALSGTIAFAQGVEVSGGYLFGRTGSQIDGDVNVSGGTFGSAGTVNGNVQIGAGGTLSPGSSPGVMIVNGDVAFGTGSATTFELAPVPAPSDQLIVAGDVAIATGTTIKLTGSLTPGRTYELIVADSIDGQFTTVNQAPTMRGVLSYTANRLRLLGTFVTPAGLASQPAATIGYVNSVLQAGQAGSSLLAAMPSLLGSSGTASSLAFSQIGGEAYASASQLGVDHGLTLAKSSRIGFASNARAEGGPFTFVQGLGNWQRLKRDSAVGTSGAKSHSYGVLGGLGIGSTTASVGAFVGYLDSRQTIRDLGARTEADGVVAGVAARYAGNGFDLNGVIAYDWSDADTRRTVPGATVIGSYKLRSLVVDASAGYSFPVGGSWALRPEAGLTHISSKRGEVVESGSALALNVDSRRTKATFVDGALQLKGGIDAASRVHPWAMVGIRHQLDGELGIAHAGFLGTGTGLTFVGAERKQTLATAGAGFSIDLNPAVSLYGAYRGEYGGGSSHNANAGVRIAF